MLKESRSYFEEMRTKYSKPGKTFLAVDPFAIKMLLSSVNFTPNQSNYL